jgi:hypothetical protein
VRVKRARVPRRSHAVAVRATSMLLVVLALTSITPIAIAGAARSHSVVPTTMSTCPRVAVFGARGTGQAAGVGLDGMGSAVKAIIKQMVKELALTPGSITYSALDYPAVSVLDAIAGTVVSGLRYDGSRERGVIALRSDVYSQVNACPDTRLVLAGYSQGADVVASFLQELAPRSKRVDFLLQQQLAGVVLLGDPRFNPRNVGVAGGSYNPRFGPLFSKFGTPPKPFSPPGARRLFAVNLENRIYSVCNAGDAVCNYSIGNGNSCFGPASWARFVKNWLNQIIRRKPKMKNTCPHFRYGDPGPAVVAPGHRATAAAAGHALAIRVRTALEEPLITTRRLPAATLGVTYLAQLTVSGGTAPLTWRIDRGGLPIGLELSAEGAITGIPSAPGTSKLTVTVTDAIGRSRSAILTTPKLQPNPAPVGTLTRDTPPYVHHWSPNGRFGFDFVDDAGKETRDAVYDAATQQLHSLDTSKCGGGSLQFIGIGDDGTVAFRCGGAIAYQRWSDQQASVAYSEQYRTALLSGSGTVLIILQEKYDLSTVDVPGTLTTSLYRFDINAGALTRLHVWSVPVTWISPSAPIIVPPEPYPSNLQHVNSDGTVATAESCFPDVNTSPGGDCGLARALLQPATVDLTTGQMNLINVGQSIPSTDSRFPHPYIKGMSNDGSTIAVQDVSVGRNFIYHLDGTYSVLTASDSPCDLTWGFVGRPLSANGRYILCTVNPTSEPRMLQRVDTRTGAAITIDDGTPLAGYATGPRAYMPYWISSDGSLVKFYGTLCSFTPKVCYRRWAISPA